MSSQLYVVHDNRKLWQLDKHPVIEGEHRWKLPSLKCLACGVVRGSMSLVYPWVDLPVFKGNRIYRGDVVCVMEQDEFENARRPVAAALPPDHPLKPGTSLGPYKGKLTAGELEDFYLYLGSRFISRTAYKRLREKGALSIGATPARIRARRPGQTLDYLELHLVPRARLAVPKVQKPKDKYCPVCGFDSRSLPEPLVIAASSVPEHEELFQLADAPGILLARQGLVEAVGSLGLTGIEFEPVEVSDQEPVERGVPGV